MDQYFREALEGLRDTARHLMAASEQIQLAGGGLVRVTEAALHAQAEHVDLRETVTRLETTVLDLVREVRALREAR